MTRESVHRHQQSDNRPKPSANRHLPRKSVRSTQEVVGTTEERFDIENGRAPSTYYRFLNIPLAEQMMKDNQRNENSCSAYQLYRRGSVCLLERDMQRNGWEDGLGEEKEVRKANPWNKEGRGAADERTKDGEYQAVIQASMALGKVLSGSSMVSRAAIRPIVTLVKAPTKDAKLLGYTGCPKGTFGEVLDSLLELPDGIIGKNFGGGSQLGSGTYFSKSLDAAKYFAAHSVKGSEPGKDTGEIYKVHGSGDYVETEVGSEDYYRSPSKSAVAKEPSSDVLITADPTKVPPGIEVGDAKTGVITPFGYENPYSCFELVKHSELSKEEVDQIIAKSGESAKMGIFREQRIEKEKISDE